VATQLSFLPPVPRSAAVGLWHEGLGILRDVTKAKNLAATRPLLGRLCDAAGRDDAGLLDLLRQAKAQAPSDPVSWLMAGCQRLREAAGGGDAGDPWGLTAALASLPPDSGGNPFSARSWPVEALHSIMEAAAFPVTWRGRTDMLWQWLADGYQPDSIAEIVREQQERFAGPITGLGFFDRPVRRRARRWDAVRCEWRVSE
jgi:hypothetical protein